MKAHAGPSESAPLTAAKPMKPSSQGHPAFDPGSLVSDADTCFTIP